jgi:hypothetical protein
MAAFQASASLPMGVDSSSAVIKSGNLIRNIEIDKSSITAQGNSFNGASQLVQMGSDGKLPAIDGSKLTGIGGGGTVTTQGTPAAGQVMISQGGTVISTGSYITATSTGVTVSTNITLGGNGFLGISTSSYLADNQGNFYRAFLSMDGISESSGCMMGVTMSSPRADAQPVITSTTTASGGRALMLKYGADGSATCQPNTYCWVLWKGIGHAVSQAGQAANTNFQTSAVRCALRTDASDSGPQGGSTISAVDSNNWQWILAK